VRQLRNIKNSISYCREIKKFVDSPLTIEECRAFVERNVQRREENFLHMVSSLVYGRKKSPYRTLLEHAQIAEADVKAMVHKSGIEETLRFLKDEGIYFTFEEFKGRCTTIRKGREFSFSPSDFQNDFSSALGRVCSGSSQGSGTMINWGHDYLLNRAIHEMIMFDMYDCRSSPCTVWYPVFPSHVVLYALRLRKMKMPIQVWHSPVRFPKKQNLQDWLDLHMYKNVALKNIELQHVPLNDPSLIVEWAAGMIQQHGKCSISTFASGAVRICQAAQEKGISIASTIFFVAGEPLTLRKRREIEKCGCAAVNAYYFSEGGFVGCTCPTAATADAVHFFSDSFSVIQHERELAHCDQKVQAFLFSSFYRNCPIVMLNLENGDHGNISDVQCGYAGEQRVAAQHISNIRSFEKITTEGVTFYIDDFVRVIEEYFPKRFGGASIDYQLVEEETTEGISRLYIYIHPKHADVTLQAVKEVLLTHVSKTGERDSRVSMWKQIEALQIKRVAPIVTVRGKTPSFMHGQQGKSISET